MRFAPDGVESPKFQEYETIWKYGSAEVDASKKMLSPSYGLDGGNVNQGTIRDGGWMTPGRSSLTSTTRGSLFAKCAPIVVTRWVITVSVLAVGPGCGGAWYTTTTLPSAPVVGHLVLSVP